MRTPEHLHRRRHCAVMISPQCNLSCLGACSAVGNPFGVETPVSRSASDELDRSDLPSDGVDDKSLNPSSATHRSGGSGILEEIGGPVFAAEPSHTSKSARLSVHLRLSAEPVTSAGKPDLWSLVSSIVGRWKPGESCGCPRCRCCLR